MKPGTPTRCGSSTTPMPRCTRPSTKRARWQFFDDALVDEVTLRLELEDEIHLALEREEFVLHYQPVFDLESGAVVGAEALLRWAHPTRGLIAPSGFTLVAEQTGLIVPIGAW